MYIVQEFNITTNTLCALVKHFCSVHFLEIFPTKTEKKTFSDQTLGTFMQYVKASKPLIHLVLRIIVLVKLKQKTIETRYPSDLPLFLKRHVQIPTLTLQISRIRKTVGDFFFFLKQKQQVYTTIMLQSLCGVDFNKTLAGQLTKKQYPFSGKPSCWVETPRGGLLYYF